MGLKSLRQAKSKLEQLEGLRGVAAFVVLLGHLRLTFFVHANDLVSATYGRTVATLFEAILDGDFAVWLFWVMSAFVLSLRFFASRDEVGRSAMLTDATLRRYPRLLLPVIASVLFAWALHQSSLMSNQRLADLLGHDYQRWLGSFYSFEPDLVKALKSGIWQTFFAYSKSQTYNAVLWTMEIELYGSFFLFAYLAIIGSHSKRYLLYLATLFVLFKLSMHWISAFVLGAMICDAFVHRASILEFIPVALRGFVLRFFHSPLIVALLTLPIMYLIGLENVGEVLHLALAVFLTAYIAISQPAGKFFSLRIPVFLGKISFGLYLVHLPIICTMAYPIYSAFSTVLITPWAALVSSFVLIILSLAGGWCLWFIADRPAIAFSKLVSKTMSDRFIKK